MTQLQSLWSWALSQLMSSSTTPHLDVELLLSAHLGLTRPQLHARATSLMVSETQQQSIETAVYQRKSGKPIAYLLEQQEFWSLLFEVNPSVLIPRPETELLVELVLDSSGPEAKKIADLGTGSGAIAIALASERATWEIIATDYCEHALQLADRNRYRHGVDNIALRQGDWCHAFGAQEQFDIIISNPPYLAPDDPYFQSEAGLHFEPRLALVAAENGLNHLESIVKQARVHLHTGGTLFLEHGYGQATYLGQFFLKYGYNSVQHYKDLAGHPRAMSGKWH